LPPAGGDIEKPAPVLLVSRDVPVSRSVTGATELAPSDVVATAEFSKLAGSCAAESPWILSESVLEAAGITVLRNNTIAVAVASSGLVYPLRRESNGLIYLDGHMTRRGVFMHGPVPRGANLPTLSLLVDGGATINIAEEGWNDHLDVMPGLGRAACGVGGTLIESEGWGTLSLMFPRSRGRRWTANQLLSMIPGCTNGAVRVNPGDAAASSHSSPGEVFKVRARRRPNPVAPVVDDAAHEAKIPAIGATRVAEEQPGAPEEDSEATSRGRYAPLNVEQVHRRLHIINPVEMKKYPELVIGVDPIVSVKGIHRSDYFHQGASKRSWTYGQ
jgi:hypothetical protein